MIEVVPYSPAWPAAFDTLRAEYAEALASAGVPVVTIEHVGSTAVPGLAAKPVIDVDVVVPRAAVAAASDVLVGLGFEARGEVGIPDRWAFYAPARLGPTNTYVVVDGSLALRNHLAVRDTLRGSAALREEYGAVKLALRDAADIYDYGAGKNATVQRILAAAGLSDAERASIDENQVPVSPPRPGR
jgi:GrpB-like predicted nucleotidyltransferase (UPF0157 family)